MTDSERLQRIERAIAELGTLWKGQWTPRKDAESALGEIMVEQRAIERRPHQAPEQRSPVMPV